VEVLRDAYVFVIPLAAGGALLLALGARGAGWLLALGALLLGLAAFVAYFFRDPEREAPVEADLVVAPADGRVVVVAPLEETAPGTLVSIFLTVFDVHVNRAPIAGTIRALQYQRGRFMIANDRRASVENEQNVVTIENEQMRVVLKQIAGLIARRIVFWKRLGDRVELGERVGLIKFGSRTDLLLPPQVEVLVKVGDRVKGGVTVIGKVGS
jgi:phosphatidylserine decarboxylase